MARKILLADDSVTAQNMGRKILADAGYEVITVNNGSAALKKIAEQKPDLIVLDVYMPGYSGLEVCQRLKESQETARVPVLLTVGKLEPFKPEEAKRARADGFIVKPFEASELLSALSKLEDKIVPRAEASKPGRFARATAALDEGRYDKSVAIDEDSGWKNRIQFPSKGKAKPAQEDGDESEIYNAMNKDLRTVVENKIAHEPRVAQPEEARVDLGALAPEGLPNNVTPEEIAALAAAAAQVKGKIAESRPAESAPVEIKQIEIKQIETEKKSAEHTSSEQSSAEQSSAEQGQVAPALAQEPAAATPAAASDAPKEAKESIGTVVPSASDVMAAIAGLEVEAVSSSTNFEPNSSNGPQSQRADGRDAQAPTEHEAASDRFDVPATMAVASGSDSAVAARWTAVAVALSPDEAALSLELEMQKAYAAYAAADAGHGISPASAPEAQFLSPEPVAGISSPAAPAAIDVVASVPAIPAPEAAQGLTEMAAAATDAISAAVKELEAVAESYLAHNTSAVAETEAVRAPESEPASPTTEPVSEAKSEASPVTPQPETKTEESPAAGWQQTTSEIAQPNSPSAPEVAPSDGKFTPAPYDPSLAVTAEMALPSFGSQAFPEHITGESSSSPASSSPASSVPTSSSAAASEPVSRDLANDSDMSSATAAAWASWRQIRESSAPGSGTPSGTSTTASSQGTQEKSEASPTPHDTAMAVAAGAETAPEGSTSESESDSEGIANIVDSVLADLRPKIFEEISRKMGKKK